MNPELQAQRAVTKIALHAIAAAGFALAGSGAIREHGFTTRPTEDVDLFTARRDVAGFSEAVGRVTTALTQHRCSVTVTRRADEFARLSVVAGEIELEVDMGVDWRKHEPVTLELGPVLSPIDAVANKIGALYSRGEPRDYLDVDAIRLSNRYTDPELLDSAADHDPGFDRQWFANQLDAVSRIHPAQVSRYGASPEEFALVQDRLRQWATDIRT